MPYKPMEPATEEYYRTEVCRAEMILVSAKKRVAWAEENFKKVIARRERWRAKQKPQEGGDEN